MASLSNTMIAGDMSVTGSILAETQTFIVDSTDQLAFTHVLDAYNKSKVIFMRYNAPNGINIMQVPLVQAEESNGSITKFIFAKTREFETEYIGAMEMWTCTSTNQALVKTWSYAANADTTTQATNAESAGTAATCTTASVALNCTGNATTAVRAIMDENSNQIPLTYITKSDAKYPKSWLWAVGTSYMKIDHTGDQITSGTVENLYPDYLVKATKGTPHTYPVDIKVTSDFDGISAWPFIPGYAGYGTWDSGYRFEWPQYVLYRFTVTNLGNNDLPVNVTAGGRWGVSVADEHDSFYGDVYVNGYASSTYYDTQPSSWQPATYNTLTLCSIPSKSTRVWEMFFVKRPYNGWTRHIVYANLIR